MNRALASALLLFLAAPVAAQEANPVDLYVSELRWRGGRLEIGEPARLTRGGRNTQPSFTPDGRAIVFSGQRGGPTSQTDIYRIDLATGAETQVTRTPENENTPTVEPNGELVAVRWKPETLFREYGPWVYGPDGVPRRGLLPGPDTVGYYVRVDRNTVALMRPMSRFRVALFDARSGTTTDVGSPAAPLPPQRVPGARAITYTRTDSAGRNLIRRVDVATGRSADMAPTVLGRTSHTWTPRGTLLMGKGNTLYALDPARDSVWRPVRSFAGPELQNVTAYVVSPRGDRLVFYSSARVPLEVAMRDSLQAGRSAAEVAALARRLAAGGSVAVTEGGVLGLGGDWLAWGKAAEAAQIFGVAAELFPRSHRAHARLGDAHRAAGERDRAAAAYRRALELNPRGTDEERAAAAEVEKRLGELGAG
ncbi:MAG: PD40 domain-containing protein [Gemmatimonadetes bacterium]|nr:PD40 domain-containing protein [Gemmatimonadota bacterium]